MLCIIISTLELFVAIFVLAMSAKWASRYHQRRRSAMVDEQVAVNWQNRVALLGIMLGFLNFLSHVQFAAVPDEQATMLSPLPHLQSHFKA